MTIERLMAIPEMERNENDDGYEYPKKFQDKLYEHQGQYMIFRKSSCDAIPKELIDAIFKTKTDESLSKEYVESLIESKMINHEQINELILSQIINDEHVKSNIKDIISEYEKEYEEDNNVIHRLLNLEKAEEKFNDLLEDKLVVKEDILSMINEALASSFGNMNRVMDNWTSKIDEKIDLTDLQSFRSEIEKQINNVLGQFTADFEDLKSRPIEGVLDSTIDNVLQDKVFEIHKQFEVFKEKMIDDIKKINEQLSQTTEVIYEKIKEVVKEEVKKTTLATPTGSGKTSLGTLVALKEAGYTVEEIIKLRSEELL